MPWEKYQNRSGRSGIDSYELKADGINVKFKSGDEYFYPESENGTNVMGIMHSTADHGEFLNRFINSDKPKYSKGANTSTPPIGDNRPVNRQQLEKMGDKYLTRNPSVADQLRMAKFRRMQSASNFNQWQQIRNK
jgi:hypothetical protein